MRHCISFILLFIPLLAFSKPGNTAVVTAKVLDAEKKPVEFAVVTLLKAEDSTLVKGALTLPDGTFTIEEVNAGKYFISVSYTGFLKKWIGPLDLPGDQKTDLHEIVLEPTKELNAVTVVSSQPLFVQKPGMLIMNIENSPVRISGTAYDVLSKAPGVSVDQDGNFSLKGKASVKIYIDGKPTYLSGEQLRDYLMNIPASDIIRIEMMNNPPAKYDAEGSSGIINLVTQKSRQQGFNGSANAGYGQGNASRTEAGLSLNYGKPKFNLYSKYDYATPQRKETKFVARTVTYNGADTRFDQNVNLFFSPRVQHLRVGADFSPSKTISWGLRADGSSVATNHTLNTRNRVTDESSGDATVLHQINSLHGKFKNGSVGVYYQQQLDTLGTELSGSFDYLSYYNRSRENYNLHFLDDAGTEILTPDLQRSFPQTDIGIYVGQVDYTHPFHKKYKLEAGVKSSYVKTSNELLFEYQNTSTGNWENDSHRSNSFIYQEKINAAYSSLSADYGKWQLQGGLRAEQTISDGNSPTTGEDHRNNYVQLFPTLFITQKINEKHSMQYSYARRINRPGYDELNPFIFYVDQYLYRLGNPFLQPEISNSVDLTHDYKDFIFTGIGASRTNYGIAQVTRLTDSTGIMTQSSVNLNTIDNAYLSVTVSTPVTKWWTNESSVYLSYNRYRSNLNGTPLDKGNLVFSGTLNETFLLHYGWKVEASAFYNSAMQYTIFFIEPTADVSLGVSKNFFKNKLRFSVNASDLFLTQEQKVKVNFGSQHLNTWYKFDSRVVWVRLRYTFGNTGAAKKSQFKNAADDLQKRAGK